MQLTRLLPLLLTFGAAAPALQAEVTKPNIILVMPDDVGYGDYSCLGNPIIKTPAADAFWKESVRFTHFHVSPTCSPTRSAIMTGRHEFGNGVTHTILERERMTLDATTLPQVLKTVGYTSGIFGKWHLGDEDAYQPGARGFDEVYIHGAGGIGQTYPGSCGDAPGNMYFDPAIRHNGVFEKTKGYCTDLFFGQATKWMETQIKAGKPFFTYLPLNAAHGPLQVSDEYFNRHKGQVPDDVAKFYGMIENLDENFGRLLGKLKEWGIEENTVVIFMTDNGSATGWRTFNAGMRGGKGQPYQGGHRVPSFWRWPAAFKGGVDCDLLSGHKDILPTLMEMTGAATTPELKAQIEGRSLLPQLRDPSTPAPPRYWITHVGRWNDGEREGGKFRQCAIQDQRYTLVNNSELYDLDNDPGETKNLIELKPEIVAAMRTAYDQWWEKVLPMMVNEGAMGPKINPFKAAFWKQFGGGPTPELLKQMDPEGKKTFGRGTKGKGKGKGKKGAKPLP